MRIRESMPNRLAVILGSAIFLTGAVACLSLRTGTLMDVAVFISVALPAATVGGLLIAGGFFGKFSRSVRDVFFPNQEAAKGEFNDYSGIKALIAAERLEEAAEMLKAAIKEEGDPRAASLLAGLYLDRMRDPPRAEAFLREWLAKPARTAEDAPLVLALADILLDHGKAAEAAAILRSEFEKTRHSQGKSLIRERLRGMT